MCGSDAVGPSDIGTAWNESEEDESPRKQRWGQADTQRRITFCDLRGKGGVLDSPSAPALNS